jgi:predicted RNA binding protein YcfA (HicA-like mRNA interferase family)
MSEPRIQFSRLRQLLADAGFREVTISAAHVGFQHDASETLIVLPEYGPNANVAPHHLAQVRVTLDAKGLVETREFERRLAQVPARHPASN